MDLTPTVLDLAGLPVPDAMQGHSMAGWCLNGSGVQNDAVYLGLGGPTRKRGWRAVWDGRYVFSPFRHNILYDHQEDPHEMYNRIEDPDYAVVRKRLADRLVHFSETTRDPMAAAVRDACRI